MAATVVSFGEWLPDMPALGNPGLTVANNVIPADNGYAPFNPLTPLLDGQYTLPGIPRGGFAAELDYPANPPNRYYAGTTDTIYLANTTGTFVAVTSGIGSMGGQWEWDFTQFDNLVFAARGVGGVLYHTAGAATNFATVPGMTGSQDGRFVFVIGRFLVVANLGSATSRPSTLIWSSIDSPLDFPTPNSATAIARQSGEQTLNIADGPIYGGFGGDQFGLILQSGRVTRMTYVGPPVVFQFDPIDQRKGAMRPYGSAESGEGVYMLASDGFYKTNGVQVAPIGEGRVDKTFLTSLDADNTPGSITATAICESAFDHKNRNILWSFPQSATTRANRIFVYNIDRNRWSSCDQIMRTFIEPCPSLQQDGLYAFNSSNVLCRFNGTAGSATLTTGDLELNPGGRAYVDGVKPNVESSATAPAVTVRIGSRSDLATTPSYTATTTPTTRTGFADFRVDAKYHRAEITITGEFKKATGIVVKSFATGET